MLTPTFSKSGACCPPVGKKTRTNSTWKQTIHIKPNEIIKKEKTSISMAKP